MTDKNSHMLLIDQSSSLLLGIPNMTGKKIPCAINRQTRPDKSDDSCFILLESFT